MYVYTSLFTAPSMVPAHSPLLGTYASYHPNHHHFWAMEMSDFLELKHVVIYDAEQVKLDNRFRKVEWISGCLVYSRYILKYILSHPKNNCTLLSLNKPSPRLLTLSYFIVEFTFSLKYLPLKFLFCWSLSLWKHLSTSVCTGEFEKNLHDIA